MSNRDKPRVDRREIPSSEPGAMTNQLDLVGLPLDEAMTRHITGKISFPVAREVRKPKLRDVLGNARQDFDLGHELILPERARNDHR